MADEVPQTQEIEQTDHNREQQREIEAAFGAPGIAVPPPKDERNTEPSTETKNRGRNRGRERKYGRFRFFQVCRPFDLRHRVDRSVQFLRVLNQDVGSERCSKSGTRL
jgi:hypothetical protein